MEQHQSTINLADPRQDVHKVRTERPTLNRFRVAESLLTAAFSQGTVLEVGGGAAEFSRKLKSLGYTVTFTDLSEANVTRARDLGFPAYRLDLNTGLPGIASEAYDAVIMLEIIEHVVAAEALLKEVARVLKPGGILILSTPNFVYWQNRVRILFGQLSHDEGYHFRFFTPSVLTKRIEEAGLKVERGAHTMPAVGLNFFINKIARRPRLHLEIPPLLAPLFAHTLIFRARKPPK